jgi:hypothetical protein
LREPWGVGGCCSRLRFRSQGVHRIPLRLTHHLQGTP